MTRWAFCKFRFTPTMPVCVIWLLKTKYFYSILFHFSVPMKNIQHNSNGSWMFFRLNVKWRKWQITRKIWRSHYEIFMNDCCVYALALNRWTAIPGELLWVERDLHGSLLNKHLPPSYEQLILYRFADSPGLWEGLTLSVGKIGTFYVTVCGCRICCRVQWERHHLILN